MDHFYHLLSQGTENNQLYLEEIPSILLFVMKNWETQAVQECCPTLLSGAAGPRTQGLTGNLATLSGLPFFLHSAGD
jgi:hypothetical protein